MQRFRSWLAAALVTLTVTIALSWMTGALKPGPGEQKHVPVIQPAAEERLTDSNLVDALAGLDLKERLGKAEWNGSVLTLELKVAAQGGRPQAWFGDIQKLIRLSFIRLDNVKRLLVRIAESDGEEKRLLVAVDVRKTDGWLDTEIAKLAYADPVHDELWRERLRLSFTRAWEERFGPISGYSATSAEQ